MSKRSVTAESGLYELEGPGRLSRQDMPEGRAALGDASRRGAPPQIRVEQTMPAGRVALGEGARGGEKYGPGSGGLGAEFPGLNELNDSSGLLDDKPWRGGPGQGGVSSAAEQSLSQNPLGAAVMAAATAAWRRQHGKKWGNKIPLGEPFSGEGTGKEWVAGPDGAEGAGGTTGKSGIEPGTPDPGGGGTFNVGHDTTDAVDFGYINEKKVIEAIGKAVEFILNSIFSPSKPLALPPSEGGWVGYGLDDQTRIHLSTADQLFLWNLLVGSGRLTGEWVQGGGPEDDGGAGGGDVGDASGLLLGGMSHPSEWVWG